MKKVIIITECTEDNGSTAEPFATLDGRDDELILGVSPEPLQCDSLAVARDNRHHPVTKHLVVVRDSHGQKRFLLFFLLLITRNLL